MNPQAFSEKVIISMNQTYLWRDKKIVIEKKEENDLYYIYPTGYADSSGRCYVALPIQTNIHDPAIQKKYNLI